MNIIIRVELQETLARIADERGMTVEAYIAGYVESHLLSQYRQNVFAKMGTASLEELVQYDAAISATSAGILAKRVEIPFNPQPK